MSMLLQKAFQLPSKMTSRHLHSSQLISEDFASSAKLCFPLANCLKLRGADVAHEQLIRLEFPS